MQQQINTVGVNEHGQRIGEYHPRARLSDEDVIAMLNLIDDLIDEEGRKPMEAYRLAAEKFEITVQHVKNIRAGQRRCQTIARYKRVRGGRETTPPPVPALSPRRERFCREFAECGNASEAARRAGYPAQSARQIGSSLLSEERVRTRIANNKGREAA